MSVVIDVLLVLGVAIELACCVGVLVMGDAYDKLHYLGPATTLGPVCIAGAVVAREALGQAGVKSILTAALLVVAGPVLAHATARAMSIRQRDGEPT